eukprot:gene16035-biopygen287
MRAAVPATKRGPAIRRAPAVARITGGPAQQQRGRGEEPEGAAGDRFRGASNSSMQNAMGDRRLQEECRPPDNHDWVSPAAEVPVTRTGRGEQQL